MKYNYLKIKELVDNGRMNKKTINEQAEEMGVGFSTLRRIIEGKFMPNLDNMVKIATYYSKDMNYFFDVETSNMVAEPEATYGTDYKQQAEMYKKLYDDLIDKMLKNNGTLDESKVAS